jgi:uncharacterized membrane protein YeaQ/YmgE (transglycosylase-associated protein family)
MTDYIAWIATGILAGWLVGLIMRGQGYGLVGDLILGLLGGVAGGFLFRTIGAPPPETSWLVHALVAAIGGIVLVACARLLRRVL